MNSHVGQNSSLSVKSLTRNVIVFQLIIPGSAILCILGIQTNKWLDESVDRHFEGTDLQSEPEKNYLISERQSGIDNRGFYILAEPIIIWCYCFLLLIHIGFALLLCNGVAKQSFCKLSAWIISELVLSFAGIAFCVLLTNLDIQYCIISIIVVITSIQSVVSVYSIIVIVIFLNKTPLTRNFEGSVRFEARCRNTSQSCTDNLNKSTQTLGSTH